MSAARWLLPLVAAVLALGACGRWSKRDGVEGTVSFDEGVLASATAEWYPDGERTLFAPRSTGILIVTAEQVRFLTYDDRSEEYRAALTLSRSGLNCSQPSASVSRGELWCHASDQAYLFVSKDAGQIAAAFVEP